jgi:hypothetical protein
VVEDMWTYEGSLLERKCRIPIRENTFWFPDGFGLRRQAVCAAYLWVQGIEQAEVSSGPFQVRTAGMPRS